MLCKTVFILQVKKREPLIALGSHQGAGVLISASAVPHCAEGRQVQTTAGGVTLERNDRNVFSVLWS